MTEVTTKPYLSVTRQSQKFDSRRGNIREHVVCPLDSMGAHAHDVDLCIREFSKSLMDRADTWYVF